MATHSSILAWRIPWIEEPGGLQFMGLQRVRHDWVTNIHGNTRENREIMENGITLENQIAMESEQRKQDVEFPFSWG